MRSIRTKRNFYAAPDSFEHGLTRAGIYISAAKSFSFLPLAEFTGRDVSAGLLESGELSKPIIIASVYMDGLIASIPELFLNLIEYCKRERIPLLVGSDTNAWSSFWSSPEDNKRGEMVEEVVINEGLAVLNSGSECTFRRNLNGVIVEKIIDVTFSLNLDDPVTNWEVSEDSMFSDHRPITWTIGKQVINHVEVLNLKKANWEVFRDSAGAYDMDKSEEWTQGRVERELTTFYNNINESIELAIPKARVKNKDNIEWWTAQCEDDQAHLRAMEHLVYRDKKSDQLPALRDARQKYSKTLRKERQLAYRKLVGETETVHAMAKLSKILNKKNIDERLGLLTKPDGSRCKNSEENLATLLTEHFPGSTPRTEPATAKEFPREVVQHGWINRERIRAAIDIFGPHKSPGTDGLKPVILQHLPDKALDKLGRIFNASISLGYTPAQWRNSEVIFIPKPGKRDYCDPRAFRPISLTCFLFKTLERLVMWRIEESDAKPLHSNQYAFQKGRSTEHALSRTVDYIEKHMAIKENFVVGVFMDIRGAFDTISTDAIKDAMEKHNLDDYIQAWYGQYLEHRQCSAKLGDAHVQADLDRGSPQGGVGSPVVGWSMSFDDLLSIFDDTATLAIGFADDACFLQTGIDLATIMETAQHAINQAVKWATERGLTFCPKKTAVLIFTRKQRKSYKVTSNLTLYNSEVTPVREVKYLGVWIDDKLSFKKHLSEKIKAAKRALAMSRGTMRRTWGPAPKAACWLYTGVIRPALTYAAAIWYPRISMNKTNRDKLDRVQRLGLLNVSNVRRSTPTAALEIAYGVEPLDLHLKEIAARTYLRLQQPESSNDYGHLGKLKKLIPDEWKGKVLDTLPPTKLWEKNFTTDISYGSDCTLNDPSFRAYSDGSLLDRSKVGAGVVILKDNKEMMTISQRLHKGTVFQAEIHALEQAARFLNDNAPEGSVVHLLVDSQAAIKAVSSKTITSRGVLMARKALNALGKQCTVELHWIKAHAAWHYNELADKAAKAGAESNRYPEAGPLPPLAEVKAALRKKKMNEWTDRWETKEARQSKFFLVGPNINLSLQLLLMSKPKLSRLMRWITGHVFLRRQNAIVSTGMNPPPKNINISCRLCGLKNETSHHIIVFCERLGDRRQRYMDRHELDDVPDWSPANLDKFLSSEVLEQLEETQ